MRGAGAQTHRANRAACFCRRVGFHSCSKLSGSGRGKSGSQGQDRGEKVIQVLVMRSHGGFGGVPGSRRRPSQPPGLEGPPRMSAPCAFSEVFPPRAGSNVQLRGRPPLHGHTHAAARGATRGLGLFRRRGAGMSVGVAGGTAAQERPRRGGELERGTSALERSCRASRATRPRAASPEQW